MFDICHTFLFEQIYVNESSLDFMDMTLGIALGESAISLINQGSHYTAAFSSS